MAHSTNRGKFIIIEGLDGSGKTTLAQNLKTQLQVLLKTHNSQSQIVLTYEPGGTELGLGVRQILKQGREDLDGLAELLLLLSARHHHFHQVIEPSLKRGDWVICDRFIASSYAYQGYGRGLSIEQVERLHREVLGFDLSDIPYPNTHLVIELEAKQSLQRRQKESGTSGLDRFEKQSLEFYQSIEQGFIQLGNLAKKRDQNWLSLDGHLNPQTLSEQSVAYLKKLWFNIKGTKSIKRTKR